METILQVVKQDLWSGLLGNEEQAWKHMNEKAVLLGGKQGPVHEVI